MRFVTGYLIVYFALVLGAVLALWYGGALQPIGALRVFLAVAIAVALGLLLAFATRRVAVARDDSDTE